MALTDAPETSAPTAPMFGLVGQYIKDLSFECFRPAFSVQDQAPVFDLQLNAGAEKLSDEQYSVHLELKAVGKAKDVEEPVYILELEYVGVFVLKNIPADRVKEVLAVEGPSQLFPYAREIIMRAIMDGGYRCGIIQPINFAALYIQQQMQAAQAAEGQAAAN